jgi:hypothetical protein
MSQTLMEGAEVEVAPRKGGLLGTALPAPQGWTQGLSIPFYGCGEPVLQDRCVTANDVDGADGPHRTSVAEFGPFGISQGATCSTLSRLDQKRHAEARLESTTEWAVARQLATDGIGLGTPSLEDGLSLGTVADGDFVLAVATLEQAAADNGFGAQWWLHAPVKAAAYLAAADQMEDGMSAAGAPWIISPGYPVLTPTTVRLWATGPVWASTSDSFVLNDVDWTVNEDTAFANRDAIVAFDPCINLYIDITVPASPIIGSE